MTAPETPPVGTFHVICLRRITVYTTVEDAEECGVEYVECDPESNPAKRAPDGTTAVRVAVEPGEVVPPSAGFGAYGLIRQHVACVGPGPGYDRLDHPDGPTDQSVPVAEAEAVLDRARQRLREGGEAVGPGPKPGAGP
jgi:hypothetical protein